MEDLGAWRDFVIGWKGMGGLEALQTRLENAVSSVKATTTAVRNNGQCKISEDLREMAAADAKCRDPMAR